MNNFKDIGAQPPERNPPLLMDELAEDSLVRPELQRVAQSWREADPVDASRDARILADTLLRNRGLAPLILDDPATSFRLRQVLSEWLCRTDIQAAEADALLLFRATTEWADHTLNLLIHEGPTA